MPESGVPQNGPKANFRTIALIVGAAMFMEQLDGTVLATALPSMARELGVSAPSLSIALTSYLISLAIFIPVSGRIADRFGARTVFRSAIVIFLLGSITCANAPNVIFLVLARFFEGIGGALMMPVGRLVLMRNVEKRDLIQATSWVLIPAVVGPILGPPVGGFIVTYLHYWRWIFYHQCAHRPAGHRAGQPFHRQHQGRGAGKDRLQGHLPLQPVAGPVPVRLRADQP